MTGGNDGLHPKREFLGWDRPFLPLLVEWLLARRDELPGLLVVVPTAQAGRRLREALAEGSGVLGLRVVTPAFFLQGEGMAPNAVELAAWVEVLEGVEDWSEFAAVFSEPPGEGETRGWALPLARSLGDLRRMLQEAGLTIAMAAGRFADGIESERWKALSGLERRVERQLRDWGWRSKSTALADDPSVLPAGIAEIVVAGVTDVKEVLVKRWEGLKVAKTILVAGPEGSGVDEWGRPLEEDWTARELPWPEGKWGSVQVAADPRQQAEMVVEAVAAGAEESSEVAIGSADEEVAGELVRSFGRRGWELFDPSGTASEPGLARWFGIWRRWLAEPRLAAVADLLGRSETGVLVKGKRAQKAAALCAVRDEVLADRGADLRRLLEGGEEESNGALEYWSGKGVDELSKAVEALEKWRDQFLAQGFVRSMERLVPILARTSERTAEEAGIVLEFVEEVREVAGRIDRDAGFWIEVMLASLPEKRAAAPDGRVADVVGWLELAFEPGRHLVVAGMNEGIVPARSSGEPWVSESGRRQLGLTTGAQRAARDSFLFASLCAARRDGGRVDVVCGKTSAGGDALLPSRLLLAAGREDLPARVTELFREVEPPDAGLRWEADWKWQPPARSGPERMHVTGFASYLTCPTRFYLKQVVRMQRREVDRGEWNARDFGNVAHEVLERWGRDAEARDYSKTKAIGEWVEAEMENVLQERFGGEWPLAVAIQVESLRQRLWWFARKQACERAEGWEVAEVEKRIAIEIAGMAVSGKVDRIDRHKDGRWRVLDYKTGKVKDAEGAHRAKVTGATRLPAHLEGDERLYAVSADAKGREVRKVWRNLQLPMYAAGLAEMEGTPELGYFLLGATEGGVGVECWGGFTGADRDSAVQCAELVVEKVQAGVFGPPALRVDYDDFAELGMGRPLGEMVEVPVRS